MNFKSLGLSAMLAGTATAVVFAATPAQAVTLFSGDTIDFSPAVGSTVKVKGTNLGNPALAKVKKFDFTGGIQVTSATGGFLSYLGQFGTIKDVSFVNGVSGSVNEFFTVGSDLVFNLDKATSTIAGDLAGFDFDGNFTNSSGDFLGFGSLTTQVNLNNQGNDKPSSFSGTAQTQVPTPALLPGLVGMGVAALRKRKSEELETQEA